MSGPLFHRIIPEPRGIQDASLSVPEGMLVCIWEDIWLRIFFITRDRWADSFQIWQVYAVVLGNFF